MLTRLIRADVFRLSTPKVFTENLEITIFIKPLDEIHIVGLFRTKRALVHQLNEG